MKIAILSLVLHTNYGGILQAYALQTILERMGHKVEVLSTRKKCSMPPFYKLPLCYIKRLFHKIFRNWKSPIFYEQKINSEYITISKNTQKFIDKYIKVRMVDNLSDIQEGEYDIFVVGSDQVWRPVYFENQWKVDITNAFLSFTEGWNVKRISYAPSFGVDVWEYSTEQTIKCRNLINQFDKVSVREESGIFLCKQNFGIDPACLLDPTLLLGVDEYRNLIQDEPQSEGDLLVYILDECEEKSQIVHRISKEKGLHPFSVINTTKETESATIRVQPKVETWLKGFEDAKFVVTDSFHACVFSILFQKPFVVIANEGRGKARLESLLKLFSLESNLIDYRLYNNSFDYSPIQDKLPTLRKKSIEWILSAIGTI